MKNGGKNKSLLFCSVCVCMYIYIYIYTGTSKKKIEYCEKVYFFLVTYFKK